MVNIRVGLNSGQIRAGVVGIDSPRFKLFGDTVNTASRMESTCEPGRVQVSPTTWKRLSEDIFVIEERGEIPVKGKGLMRTAFVVSHVDGDEVFRRGIMIERGQMGPGVSERDSDEYASQQSSTSERPQAPHMAARAAIGKMVEGDVLASDHAADGKQSKPDLSLANMATTFTLVSAALGREAWTMGEQMVGIQPANPRPTGRVQHVCEHVKRLFLLVPPSQKQPQWIEVLRQDRPIYAALTLQGRIARARYLTIMWLLILALLSGIDFFMDVLEDNLPRYRSAIIIRALGLNVVGLAYLLLLDTPRLSSRHVQVMTMIMLIVAGASLLSCGTILYNGEVAIIVMYDAYILFYTVCTVSQRLTVCALGVLGFVVAEYARCDMDVVIDAAKNIAFLIIFIVSMTCGVHLQEHLQHVSHYEQRAATRRLDEIKRAKAAGSSLLTNLLPPHVVKLVGEGVSPIAEHHSSVTIIFTDIKGFTSYSSRISPHKLVTVLNSMYSAFDEIISNWALHKVEIIGDAYFVSAGCPASARERETDPAEYAMRAVEVALALQRTLPSVCDDASVQMRVGLHTGAVVAGVVGKKGPRYHLFGTAVGYAEKMESHGVPGRVQISDTTHRLLADGGHNYDFEERSVELDGEDGPQRTWLVNKSNSRVAFQIQKKLMNQRRRSIGAMDGSRELSKMHEG